MIPHLTTSSKIVFYRYPFFIVMFIPKNLSHLKSYSDKQFSLLMYKNQIRLLSKSNDHELKSNAKKYKQLERLIEHIEEYKTSIYWDLIFLAIL